MTQKENGLYSLLAHPKIYKIVQYVAGSARSREQFAKQYIQAQTGDRILDVGCGTADIVVHLPKDIEYVGFDGNANYIKEAKERYRSRGEFYCSSFSFEAITMHGKFDIVLAQNLVHHLSDTEAIAMYKAAKRVLNLGGRFISSDPCYSEKQSRFTNWIASLDRGNHIRTPTEYDQLAAATFSKRHGVISKNTGWALPGTGFILECLA